MGCYHRRALGSGGNAVLDVFPGGHRDRIGHACGRVYHAYDAPVGGEPDPTLVVRHDRVGVVTAGLTAVTPNGGPDGCARGDKELPRAAGSVLVVADAEQVVAAVEDNELVIVVDICVHAAEQAACGQAERRERRTRAGVEQVYGGGPAVGRAQRLRVPV
jgi:hypothetical protein